MRSRTPVTDYLVKAYFASEAARAGELFDWHSGTIGRAAIQRSRGTSNGNDRGNAEDRRRRKQWLLEQFGNGEQAPCRFCGVLLTYGTITVDRIVPGARGGTYRRGNIAPACADCNSRYGGAIRSCVSPGQEFLDE